MFLVPSQQFANSGKHSGEGGGRGAARRRVVPRALRSDREEIKMLIPEAWTRSLLLSRKAGSRRRPRAVVFPLPPLVVTVELRRKRCVARLPPTAPEQVLRREIVSVRDDDSL